MDPDSYEASNESVPRVNLSSVRGAGGPEVVIVPVAFSLIFVLGMVGNSLVIVVLGRTKSRRSQSTTNTFILNLSVADLSFLLCCVPFQATIYSLPEWVFGAFLCKSVHFSFTVSMLVSIFTLVTMSVDRYIAVVHSKRPPAIRNKRNASVAVAGIWLLSLVSAVPVAQHQSLVTGYHRAPNCSFCWEVWHDRTLRQLYKVTILVIGYLLPLLLICCCYAKVLFHLHKKVKNMSKKSKRSKKTAQTVMLLVAVFLLSWLPHHIINMWVEFGYFPLNDASFAFRIISHCMTYGNSCINPIIYAFLSENFRKASRQVFRCKFLFPQPIEEKVVRIRMENFSTTPSTTNA
ncbi:galanin receptor type 1b isoform X1 [Stegostoma tigrinum]|uniref:galanin receptor type 1b isoform X1 n=1 Tax=Stegostoma tigrinum TaxID=3053191 RepID=UPI00202B9F75|nr:galanin receptor type 1b isoform X1 [Stegostoma tigrinum]